MKSRVHPSSRFNVVKTSNDDLELGVETHVEILNFGRVGVDFHSRTSFHYKLGGNFCLELANIMLSEEELPVKICDINSIQVYTRDILNSGHS